MARLIVCEATDIEFSKLRISRAYIKLLCIPESAEKIVFLTRIGNCEVRMLESSQNGSDAAPLFSIELFDHDAQLSVDVCDCFGIDEGAAAFRDFISRWSGWVVAAGRGPLKPTAIRVKSQSSQNISPTMKMIVIGSDIEERMERLKQFEAWGNVCPIAFEGLISKAAWEGYWTQLDAVLDSRREGQVKAAVVRGEIMTAIAKQPASRLSFASSS
jgi:hypothetical protein